MAAPQDVALLGSGIFAREAHLPAILAAPNLTLKAVYSRSLASIAKLCEGLQQKIDWFSDETAVDGRGLPELLSSPNIKGVIVALPILAQPDVIKAALRAGKHVLSEKPIAKDVATAQQLIEWYLRSGEVDPARTKWCVAENWRWTGEMEAARDELPKMGRVLNFRFKAHGSVAPGKKYYETAWRKTPAYQGGFVLDAGVHYVAGLRLVLGNDAIDRVSAFSAQVHEHLPPVDTVDAVMRTKNGVTGSFAVAMGTTFTAGSGLSFATEKGTLTVSRGALEIKTIEGQTSHKTFESTAEASGVHKEVKAWGEGVSGSPFPTRISVEEALADLEVVEAMLRSGEREGAPIQLTLQ